MKKRLLTKIHDHSAVVAVVGLGYVGLPLAVAFAEKGFPVIGIDVDGRKVTALNRGESYVQDISSARLAPLTNDEGRTMSAGELAAGAFRLCVWGCEVGLRFPTVKLLDYRMRWAELEASRTRLRWW